MKRMLLTGVLAAVLAMAGTALAAGKAFHADFKDLDAAATGKVTYEQFKGKFPDATMNDFKEVNTSGSGAFGEEEWTAYMNKVGMEGHDAAMHGAHK
jgi:hypothetical protein